MFGYNNISPFQDFWAILICLLPIAICSRKYLLYSPFRGLISVDNEITPLCKSPFMDDMYQKFSDLNLINLVNDDKKYF